MYSLCTGLSVSFQQYFFNQSCMQSDLYQPQHGKCFQFARMLEELVDLRFNAFPKCTICPFQQVTTEEQITFPSLLSVRDQTIFLQIHGKGQANFISELLKSNFFPLPNCFTEWTNSVASHHFRLERNNFCSLLFLLHCQLLQSCLLQIILKKGRDVLLECKIKFGQR